MFLVLTSGTGVKRLLNSQTNSLNQTGKFNPRSGTDIIILYFILYPYQWFLYSLIAQTVNVRHLLN